MYSIASFFAGVGGIDLGFELTKQAHTIYANEMDSYPIQTFEANFPIKVDQRDICDVKASEVPNIDIILGTSLVRLFLLQVIEKVLKMKKVEVLSFLRYLELLKLKNQRLFYWKM